VPSLAAATLESFATELLQAGGLSPGEAALVGRSLVGANLRGHDSHGVMRIPFYLDSLAKGEVQTGQPLTILKEGPSLLVTTGNWGFGQTLARDLMERLIVKARETGTATGTLIQASHIGRLGEYCEMAADQDLVSMVMVNTHGNSRRVAPPGGKRPRLGTNPLAIGVPAEEGLLLLDFGTSATAEGKVRVKKIAGQQCPDGWLLDKDGLPTNDPNAIYNDPPGTIRPMGGDQSYKGFGLALMIEIYCGALSGGFCIQEKPRSQNGNCVFMQILDPAHFGGAAHFASEVKELASFVRSCPKIDGVSEILLPGDPERKTLAARTAQGVPFDAGNWQQLVALAQKLGVSAPALSG